jgi:hypothetical protein
MAVDEDQAKDSERRHTTEQVAYIVFGAASGAASSATQPAQSPEIPSLLEPRTARSQVQALHQIYADLGWGPSSQRHLHNTAADDYFSRYTELELNSFFDPSSLNRRR